MTAENYGPERTLIFLLSENVAGLPQAEDFEVFTEFNGRVRQASVPLFTQLRPRHAER